MRKTKKHYADLNDQDFADSEKFWKTQTSFSEKINQMKKTLVDEEIFTQDIKVAEELNSFFSSIVKTLKIPNYSVTNPLAEQLTNPVFKINTKLWKTPKCYCS